MPLGLLEVGGSGGTRLYARPWVFEVSGLTISVCAVTIGFVLALHEGSAATIRQAGSTLSKVMANFAAQPEAAPREALVITNNPSRELTLVTALSPRGFHPSLAGNKAEVLAQLKTRGNSLKLVVVDGGVADYAAISRAVRRALPQGRVIVIQGGLRAQDIGPALLDRL